MAKTIAELDVVVGVHASRLDAVVGLAESYAEKVTELRVKHEREIAVLTEQAATTKAENAIQRAAIERLENRLWTLAVTTIFALLSAFVAVAVAFVKK